MAGRTTRPSIKDVARAADVSIGTVSNVLNRPDTVAEATRARVRAAIGDLGYVRNESARHLRAGTSRTIGLVVLDAANPFFTDVALGVEEVADARDMVVTVCNSDDLRAREDRHLEVLVEQQVAGVLITPVDSDIPRLRQLVDRGIPVVLVDRGAGARALCSVAVDDVRGGRLAGEHLRDLGHRDVAFVAGPLSIPQVSDRLRGLSSVAGARVDVVQVGALRIDDGRHAAAQLLDRPADERPTAIACANDLLALGVLQAAIARGLRVPEEVAIVGYDDIVYAGGAAVPLTSVRQPRAALGRAAATLLFEEIDADDVHEHRQVVFDPELVVRASTVAPDEG